MDLSPTKTKTTYFCVRCLRTLRPAERVRWGKGGVCQACHDELAYPSETVRLQAQHLADLRESP